MARVIEYELEGNGWARSAITLADLRVGLTASYIHDTFQDMLAALLSSCDGQQAVEWVYFHEPNSTHVYLTYAGGQQVMTLREFPGFRVPRPLLGHAGTLIGEDRVNLRDLVGDVIIAGSRMLEAHGEHGYLQSWGRPFPTLEFSRLKQLRRNYRAP